MVYFSSRREDYEDGKKVKTPGHYLLYDSDENGFYETVFILAPISIRGKSKQEILEGHGVYDVISIGYNYDGLHDFIPYINPEQVNEHIDSATNRIYGYNTWENLRQYKGEHEYGGTYSPYEWNEEKLKTINRIYGKGTDEDIWIVKDQIVEIGKIAKDVYENNRYSELYHQIKERAYDEWHWNFDNIYWDTVVNEVGKSILPGIVAIAVSMIPYVGNVLSPIAYGSIYFLESLVMQGSEKSEAKNLLKSFTYFDIDDLDKDNPYSLNKKTRQDRSYGNFDAKHPNHKSAYYYTVYGGEHGKDYTANLVIAPPQVLRGNGKTFEGYNLDYFLLTSELAALKDKYYITEVIFGTSPKVYLGNLGDDMTENDYFLSLFSNLDVYNDYRKNSIGAIEQLVKERSNDQFDTIRPYFTNGEPNYYFVHSKDIEYTKSLSPLYKPIVVSEERYDQLRRSGDYKRSEIIIDLKKAISTWYISDMGSEIQVARYLAAGLKPKILLSNKGFEYPIYYITIGHKLIDPSDYEVKDGWLYLSPSIPFDNPDTFDLHIHFDTIIYLENQDRPDTSDENGRLALAQTLSYSISDYFNQYYIAYINGKKKAEDKFILMTTAVSTAISVAILAPLAAYARSGSSAATSATQKVSYGQILANSLILIGASVVEEVFEELYLDPLIENIVKTRIDLLGGSESMGDFYALLATSIREAFGGVGSAVAGRYKFQISRNQLLSLSESIGAEQHQSALTETSVPVTSIIGTSFIAAISGQYGALLFGFASIGISFTSDFAVNLYNLHLSPEQLMYGLDMDLASALSYQQSLFESGYTSTVSFDAFSTPTEIQPSFLPNLHPATISAHLESQQLALPDEYTTSRENAIELILNVKTNTYELERLESAAEGSPFDLTGANTIGAITVDDSLLSPLAPIQDPNTILIDANYEGDIYREFRGPNFLQRTIPQFINFLQRQYEPDYSFDVYLNDLTQEFTQQDLLEGKFDKLEKIGTGETIIDTGGIKRTMGK